MKFEEKRELLLKDLCGRLPYGVKVLCLRDFNREWYNLEMIDVGDNEVYLTTTVGGSYTNRYVEIEAVKPYLFPISSMTEEQKEIYCQLQQKIIYNSKGIVTGDVMNYVKWCYENHLDVNDLIPKDLAMDATGLNIY